VALVVLVRPSLLVDLTGTFRASGRLIWIAAYALCLGAVVVVHRRVGPRATLAVLVVAAGLQFVDQRPLRRFAHDLYTEDQARAAQLDAMADLASAHDLVRLHPDYVCVPFGPQLDEYVDVVVAASLSGVPIDSTYAARQQQGSCDEPTPVANETELVVTVSTDDDARPSTAQGCVQWSANVWACSQRLGSVAPETLAFFEDP
jgi:hypothetical protein